MLERALEDIEAAMLERLAYSPREAATVLGTSRTHIYAAIARGELVARVIGKRAKIRRDYLLAWFDQQPVSISTKKIGDLKRREEFKG